MRRKPHGGEQRDVSAVRGGTHGGSAGDDPLVGHACLVVDGHGHSDSFGGVTGMATMTSGRRG